MNGCGCHDPLAFGHVCGRSGLPPDGWGNDWRALPDLPDPSPRPRPEPGDSFGRRVARLLARRPA